MKKFEINNILDGGMGREIKIRGLPFKQPDWSALVITEKPEAITDIHCDFIDQGAQIITTNTYAVVPFHIGEEKFMKKGQEMIVVACQMAKNAREKYP